MRDECSRLSARNERNPTVYEPLFVYHEEVLTAPKLLDTIFANINLSEPGSNSRNYEDTALCYWRDYVFDVQGMYYMMYSVTYVGVPLAKFCLRQMFANGLVINTA